MANDIRQIISQVAEVGEQEKKNQVKIVKVLVFELDKEEYAVYLTDLREIIRIPEITMIPNSPDFIKGIFNLRGKIVVAIDLEKRFSLVRENAFSAKHVIVTEVEGNNFGIIVDNVREVLNIPVTAIQPTPDLVSSKIHADYLKGLIVLGENEDSAPKKTKKIKSTSRLIVLLDVVKLLQDKELLQLGKTVKQATNSVSTK